MKKLILSTVVALTAGYLIWMGDQSELQSIEAEKKEQKSSIDLVSDEVNLTMQAAKIPTSALLEKDDEETKISLWKKSELAKQALQESGRLPTDLRGETYLEIDIDQLKNMGFGDYLNISIPGIEGNYDAQVNKVEEHVSGNLTVQMNFPGLARVYSASFTMGTNAMYGHLTLPTGSYTLEAQNNYAWIASKGDLSQNHTEKHDGDLSSEAPLRKSKDPEVISIYGF